MIIDEETEKAEYFAPDRDYDELDDAINIVKQNFKK